MADLSRLKASLAAMQTKAKQPQYSVSNVPTKYPYVPGNIDITQRVGKLGTPSTYNSPDNLQSRSPLGAAPIDSSSSTVYSGSFEDENGRNVLIPLVIPDRARGGYKIGTPQESIQEYRNTGQHLGIFATSDDADKYAQALHEDLAVQGGLGLRPEEQMNYISRLPSKPVLGSK